MIKTMTLLLGTILISASASAHLVEVSLDASDSWRLYDEMKGMDEREHAEDGSLILAKIITSSDSLLQIRREAKLAGGLEQDHLCTARINLTARPTPGNFAREGYLSGLYGVR